LFENRQVVTAVLPVFVVTIRLVLLIIFIYDITTEFPSIAAVITFVTAV